MRSWLQWILLTFAWVFNECEKDVWNLSLSYLDFFALLCHVLPSTLALVWVSVVNSPMPGVFVSILSIPFPCGGHVVVLTSHSIWFLIAFVIMKQVNDATLMLDIDTSQLFFFFNSFCCVFWNNVNVHPIRANVHKWQSCFCQQKCFLLLLLY